MSDPCSKYAAAKEPNDDDAHLLHEGPLAKAVAAAVSVEKALGVGEAAEEAPNTAAKALRTRMQTNADDADGAPKPSKYSKSRKNRYFSCNQSYGGWLTAGNVKC